MLPIDLHKRPDEVAEVFEFDGTKLAYPKDSVPIFARPCHAGFLPLAVRKAYQSIDHYVLYIGLARNLEQDLGDFLLSYKLEIVYFGAGEEDEIVVKISKV